MSPSKNIASKDLGNETICNNAETAIKNINSISTINKFEYWFVAVYANNFNDSLANYFSDEIKAFCK